MPALRPFLPFLPPRPPPPVTPPPHVGSAPAAPERAGLGSPRVLAVKPGPEQPPVESPEQQTGLGAGTARGGCGTGTRPETARVRSREPRGSPVCSRRFRPFLSPRPHVSQPYNPGEHNPGAMGHILHPAQELGHGPTALLPPHNLPQQSSRLLH